MSDEFSRRGEPHDPHDEAAGLRQRLEGMMPSILRRTMVSSKEAALLTEELLRSAVGEMRMPKEAVSYMVEIADTTKKEVVRVAAREFREFLESANLTEEVAKLLTTLSFEIRTEIRFIPNDQALRPNVKSSVRLKGSDDTVEEEVVIKKDSRLIEGLDDVIRAGATEFAERLMRRGRAVGAAGARVAGVGGSGAAEPPPAPPAASAEEGGRTGEQKSASPVASDRTAGTSGDAEKPKPKRPTRRRTTRKKAPAAS